jgi:hypothetical protein
MLFHRHRRRAWSRRVFAVVAVAVGSVLLSSAPPASAAAPPDVQVKIDRAVNDAKAALQRPECALLLIEPQLALFQASNVLDTASLVFEPNPPADSPGAVATVAGDAYGPGQQIRIHQGFVTLGEVVVAPDRIGTLRFAGRPESDITDGNLLRAVAILHEIGHLTLVEPSHANRIDENGNVVSAVVREGLYNSRILNTCFSPRYLIGQFSCQQVVTQATSYSNYSTINCFAYCRADAGPVTMQWTSPLQSTVTTDDSGCYSTRVSSCPVPSSRPSNFTGFRFPPVDISLTVTDASGHQSSDTLTVTCYDTNYW